MRRENEKHFLENDRVIGAAVFVEFGDGNPTSSTEKILSDTNELDRSLNHIFTDQLSQETGDAFIVEIPKPISITSRKKLLNDFRRKKTIQVGMKTCNVPYTFT